MKKKINEKIQIKIKIIKYFWLIFIKIFNLKYYINNYSATYLNNNHSVPTVY